MRGSRGLMIGRGGRGREVGDGGMVVVRLHASRNICIAGAVAKVRKKGRPYEMAAMLAAYSCSLFYDSCHCVLTFKIGQS